MIERWEQITVAQVLTTLGYGLAFITFFTPAGYAIPVNLGRLWDIATIACSCWFVLLYLSRCRVNAIWACFSLFFFSFYVLSWLVNKSDAPTLSIILRVVRAMGFLSLVAYGIERNPKQCFEGFILAGFIMCAANFYTYIKYRDILGGMKNGVISFKGRATTQHWFLFSSDNGTLFYYLPVAAAAHYYASAYNPRFTITAWIFTLLSLYMYVDMNSATALAVFGLFVVLAVIVSVHLEKPHSGGNGLPRYLWMLVAGLSFNLVMIVFLNSNFFLNLFFQLFGKAGSLLERIEIWKRSLAYYSEHLLFGMGLSMDITDIMRITYDHTHNVFLQIVYQGGTIALVLFLAGCLVCSNGRAVEEKDQSLVFLSISVLALFIAGAFDFYFHYTPLFFPLFAYGFLSRRQRCVGLNSTHAEKTKGIRLGELPRE